MTETEQTTCGYCGIVIEGCIWQFWVTHNCANQLEMQSGEYRAAIVKRANKEAARRGT